MRKSSVILGIVSLLAASYFSYEVLFVFPLLVTTQALVLNYILLGAEVLCAIFSIYLYHSIFCTLEWKHFNYKGLKKHPFVSLQIPTFNEPFNIVKKTISAALNQDYPKNRYEIIVADDSTDMNKMSKIKSYCEKNRVKFVHRNNRNGFKAGALNNIRKIAKGDLIALLDADDKPESTFLSHSVEALISEEKIAFIQTRNAERNENTNTVTGIGRMVRDLFFGAILKSKDLRNLAIFCGSGGMIKKSILEDHGGWPEETVTEDIDLSTKIFASGYISKYINPVECRGLLPPTFTGLTGQTARWAHGTTKTLMLRWRLIRKIPGFWRKMEHLLSCATYLLGPAIIMIDFIMVAHLLLRIPIFHVYEPVSLWIFGVGFTLSSFIALMFVQTMDKNVSIKRIFMYIFAIYGLSINFAKSSFYAIIGKKFVFFRTPRSASKKSLGYIARKYWLETIIGVVSIASAVSALPDPLYRMQALWVILFGIGFLTAPALAVKYG